MAAVVQSAPRTVIRPVGGPQTDSLPRVGVLSEELCGPPDEGIKKFALLLADGLRRQCDVTVLTTEGSTPPPGVEAVPAPRTFLSARLRRRLAALQPEVLVYVARSSATLMTFLRCGVLRRYCPQATIALVSLQARAHSPLQRRLIQWLAPDLIFVQSPASQRALAQLGCRVEIVPSGIDVDRFHPVDPGERRALRERYGLRVEQPVVLHVGHLKAGRGISVLATLAARRTCQVVLVTSSSTAQEASIDRRLREAGVVVVTEFQPHIEHFYQLADCYVFPVTSTDNAIEIPLSLLEALACGLPVVTTSFGGLPRIFGDVAHPGVTFVTSPAALVAEVERLCRVSGPTEALRAAHVSHAILGSPDSLVDPAGRLEVPSTRPLALPYSWESVAIGLIERTLDQRRAGGHCPTISAHH